MNFITVHMDFSLRSPANNSEKSCDVQQIFLQAFILVDFSREGPISLLLDNDKHPCTKNIKLHCLLNI